MSSGYPPRCANPLTRKFLLGGHLNHKAHPVDRPGVRYAIHPLAGG